MSALPKGWARIPVDDTDEYINAFTFKPGHRETQGLPIIRIQNLTDESKSLNRTALQVPSDYHVATGDSLDDLPPPDVLQRACRCANWRDSP